MALVHLCVFSQNHHKPVYIHGHPLVVRALFGSRLPSLLDSLIRLQCGEFGVRVAHLHEPGILAINRYSGTDQRLRPILIASLQHVRTFRFQADTVVSPDGLVGQVPGLSVELIYLTSSDLTCSDRFCPVLTKKTRKGKTKVLHTHRAEPTKKRRWLATEHRAHHLLQEAEEVVMTIDGTVIVANAATAATAAGEMGLGTVAAVEALRDTETSTGTGTHIAAGIAP